MGGFAERWKASFFAGRSKNRVKNEEKNTYYRSAGFYEKCLYNIFIYVVIF